MREPLNEDSLAEKPAIEQLRRMGYTYISGKELDPQETEDCERATRREIVLTERLRKKLRELNPEATDQTLDKAVRRVTNIQGTGLLDENRTFHRELVSHISIEQDGRNLTIRCIDFEKTERNEFLVVSQLWVKGPKVSDRPDLVVFVNGIPLAVIECKSPVAKETGTADAVAQLLRYQREIPALFRTNQLLLGVNLIGAVYGAVGAEPENFLEWRADTKELLKLGLVEKKALGRSEQEIVMAALLDKRNLLDLIRNFMVFDLNEGRVKKKVARYQQFVAAHKIVRRVLTGKEKKGIVWHWQGSGKSLTMLFSALKLRREEEKLKNPVFLIVTDRKDLDKQIADTFRDCGFPNPERAESSQQLYERLSEGVGRTLMTTVQKFRKPLDKPLTEADNVIVLVDEAHRTQYGNLALNLRKALPNAAFFAFTGTPLDKSERNTYRHFSPDGERYLDKYGIEQAERDGATVPIKYMARLASLRLVGASLDSLLAGLFPDKSKVELAEVKKKYATLEVLSRAPERVKRVTMDIVEHFHQAIKPNGFKAMIVAESREAAVAYKEALDLLLDPKHSAVAITVNKDEPWAEKYALSDEEEARVKERFNDPDNPLSFLVVCDKLLTGFDAPILQALYLDKRLREHTLLQAVARTNRTYARKNFGLIVDYSGVGQELAEALEAFSADDLNGLFQTDDVERELKALAGHRKAAMAFFKGVDLAGAPREVLQDCLDTLKDPAVRGHFDAAYRAFAKSLDFLMPDLRVEPHLMDFKFLGAVREGARNLYRDERLRLEDLSGKVEALIHAHIAAEGVERLLEPLTITAPDFGSLLADKADDRARAVHLEYALRDRLHEKAPEDPSFYESLQKRLDALIDEHKRARRDDAQLLLALMAIKDEDARKDDSARALGLDGGQEYAFYGLIKTHAKQLPVKDEAARAALAKELVAVIRERIVAEWAEREDVQKEMRRELKRALRAKGCDEDALPSIVREFVELAQHWGRE
jgi:type I restriction enzyme R subunit